MQLRESEPVARRFGFMGKQSTGGRESNPRDYYQSGIHGETPVITPENQRNKPIFDPTLGQKEQL